MASYIWVTRETWSWHFLLHTTNPPPPKFSSLFFPSCACTHISSRTIFTWWLGESGKILLRGWIQLHSWLLDMILPPTIFFSETEVEEDTADQGKTNCPPQKLRPCFYLFWTLKMNQTSQKWWRATFSGLLGGALLISCTWVPHISTNEWSKSVRKFESLHTSCCSLATSKNLLLFSGLYHAYSIPVLQVQKIKFRDISYFEKVHSWELVLGQGVESTFSILSVLRWYCPY